MAPKERTKNSRQARQPLDCDQRVMQGGMKGCSEQPEETSFHGGWEASRDRSCARQRFDDGWRKLNLRLTEWIVVARSFSLSFMFNFNRFHLHVAVGEQWPSRGSPTKTLAKPAIIKRPQRRGVHLRYDCGTCNHIYSVLKMSYACTGWINENESIPYRFPAMALHVA